MQIFAIIKTGMVKRAQVVKQRLQGPQPALFQIERRAATLQAGQRLFAFAPRRIQRHVMVIFAVESARRRQHIDRAV